MKKCKCPFCDHELLMKCFEPVFCKTCKIVLVKCETCGKLHNKKFKECPHCGREKNKKTAGKAGS
jgi:hypothetical protein